MTIWITGMGGFVGQAVARQAALCGQPYAGIGRTGPLPLPQDIASLLVDLPISFDSLAKLADRHGLPEVVVHAAGSASVGASINDPWGDFSANTLTTQLLCEYLRQYAPSARLVLISSAAVYGDRHDGPIPQDTPPAPLSPYGYNKLAAELIVRSYAENFGLRAAIVRLFSVYGPGLRKQVLWDLCSRLRRESAVTLWGTGEERRDFVHVDDAARLLLLAAESAATKPTLFNGGTGTATTMRNVADLVADEWNRVLGKRCSVSFNGNRRQGDPTSLVAACNIAQIAGFATHISLRDGIAGYVRWFATESGSQ